MLTMFPTVQPGGLGSRLRATAVTQAPTTQSSPTGSPPPAAAPETENALEPARALSNAVQTAARELFKGHDVEISSFRDDQSGRFVYRVADSRSGQVLAQQPPEELLRFYASMRNGDSIPLIGARA